MRCSAPRSLLLYSVTRVGSHEIEARVSHSSPPDAKYSPSRALIPINLTSISRQFHVNFMSISRQPHANLTPISRQRKYASPSGNSSTGGCDGST